MRMSESTVSQNSSKQAAAALVTGGGSGIGRAIAFRLARRGPVGVFDRNESSAAAVARAICDSGQEAVALAGDVTTARDLSEACTTLSVRYGALDTAVACAGVDTYGGLLEASEEDWNRVMNINAKGVLLTAREALPHLLRNGGGSLIAIASDAGLVGCPGLSIYCASKHAVIGLIRSIACEFASRGIRANAVCPAFVDTPMSVAYGASAPREEMDYWHAVVPLQRFGRADEVASVVAYLASGGASYVNGVAYALDGGATAELHRGAA
jgi:meso-butanediol dehydrogenase/(S,S)-butanediol dehydrogenase/diacetyl reductase